MFWVLLFLAQTASAQSALPAQIARGETLFFDTAGCGTCHALKGKGTAVGPDLKGIGHVSPGGIATAVRSTVTQYVQVVKVKSVGSFPAMPPAAGDQPVTIYDLSKMPPEPHNVERSDLGSSSPNNGWKHPPSVKKLTDQQMADVIAYIRYAATGSKAAVDPSDIQ